VSVFLWQGEIKNDLTSLQGDIVIEFLLAIFTQVGYILKCRTGCPAFFCREDGCTGQACSEINNIGMLKEMRIMHLKCKRIRKPTSDKKLGCCRKYLDTRR